LILSLVCAAAVLGSSAPAMALTVEMRDPDADADCFAAFSGGNPTTGSVEIEATSQIEMSDEEPTYHPDRSPTYPKYRLRTTFKVKERYGRKWKRLRTRVLRTRLLESRYFEGDSLSSAFPVLKRKYHGSARKRIRAVKGTAKLELLSASGSVIAKTKAMRFSVRTGGCTLRFGG
jgi:hypothetical protein